MSSEENGAQAFSTIIGQSSFSFWSWPTCLVGLEKTGCHRPGTRGARQRKGPRGLVQANNSAELLQGSVQLDEPFRNRPQPSSSWNRNHSATLWCASTSKEATGSLVRREGGHHAHSDTGSSRQPPRWSTCSTGAQGALSAPPATAAAGTARVPHPSLRLGPSYERARVKFLAPTRTGGHPSRRPSRRRLATPTLR